MHGFYTGGIFRIHKKLDSIRSQWRISVYWEITVNLETREKGMTYKKNADRGWRREIVISKHFEGPTDLALGGHISGLMGVHIDSDTVEVTMRKPTYMERPLTMDTTTPDRVYLYDGDTLLNEARPAELEVEMPHAISLDQAKKASCRHEKAAFPNCFGCGSGRAEDRGLHLRSGPVEGQNLVAIDWVPEAGVIGVKHGERVPETMLLTGMECPIAKAMEPEGMRKPHETVVLGRMTTKIISLPLVGGQYYFMGWPIERAGRRIEIAGTLNSESGDVLAMTRLTFVVLREGVSLFPTS